MKVNDFLGWHRRLSEILTIEDNDLRDARLSNMMTDLEIAYNIPMLRSKSFEESNPQVIKIYKQVSNLRFKDHSEITTTLTEGR